VKKLTVLKKGLVNEKKSLVNEKKGNFIFHCATMKNHYGNNAPTMVFIMRFKEKKTPNKDSERVEELLD
jgi:hypothetical protein